MRALGAAVAAALLASCAGEPGAITGRAAQAIIHGTISPPEQDFVVLLAMEKDGKMVPLCTGTLIAKDLLITARHCVGDVTADDQAIIDYAPEVVKVFVGRDAGAQTIDRAPVAQGKRIFHDGAIDLVPDIAVLEVDRALDAPIAPLRLASGVERGESLAVVGYGVTETDQYPRLRRQRTVEVRRVGPATSRHFDLVAGEFQFGEAACAGDSGGPALASATGALVGIASRVANGLDATTPSSFCTGDAAEDVYTDLTTARAFIEEAFAATGATPWLEGEPPPTPDEPAPAASAGESSPTGDGCAIAARPRSAPAGATSLGAAAALLVTCALRRRARRRGPAT